MDALHRKVSSFQSERARAREDFLPLADFDRLSAKLGGFRHEDLIGEGKATRDIIAEAIDELIRFTNAR